MSRNSFMTESETIAPQRRSIFTQRSLFPDAVLLPYISLCFANAAEAVEVLGAGYVLERITAEMPVQTLIAASSYFGMLVGGIFSGAWADRMSRRVVLCSTLALGTFSTLAAAAAPNEILFGILRVLAGVGVGGAMPPIFALATELAPPGSSSKAVCAVASFWMAGSLFASAMGYAWFGHASSAALEPTLAWDALWRRFVLSTACLPVASLCLCVAFVKDTPAGVTAEASEVAEPSSLERGPQVRQPHETSGLSDARETSEVHEPLQPPWLEGNPSSTSEGIRKVFKDHRPALLPLLLSWFGLNFGYYGLATWVTVLLRNSGVHDEYFVAIIYAAANLPGNLLSIFIVERVGA